MPGWDVRCPDASESDATARSPHASGRAAATSSDVGHLDDTAALTGAAALLGQPVFVRWEEDGWFYPAVVRDYLGGGVFTAEDEGCVTEAVAASALIVLDDGPRPDTPGQAVLAEHPAYECSFCPGRVHRQPSDGELLVVFYDHTAARLDDVMAYRLPRRGLYRHLVRFAEARDAAQLGRAVLARAPEDALYYRGHIVALGGRPRDFTVAFEDGGLAHDTPLTAMVDVPGGGRRATVPGAGGHAIALYYDGQAGDAYEHAIFGPAKVGKGGKLRLDGRVMERYQCPYFCFIP